MQFSNPSICQGFSDNSLLTHFLTELVMAFTCVDEFHVHIIKYLQATFSIVLKSKMLISSPLTFSIPSITLEIKLSVFKFYFIRYKFRIINATILVLLKIKFINEYNQT